MEKLRALIVDDEDLARRGLRLRLDQYEDLEVIAECTNGREALAVISKENPDLVFLDIQMPGLDGFDVIRNLQDDDMPLVIFVTAFDQYAIDAFEVHAVDYILKPPDSNHISRALDRARLKLEERQALNDKHRLLSVIGDITGKSPLEMEEWLVNGDEKPATYPEKIRIRDGSSIKVLPVNDIDWVDAAGDYMCVHNGGKVHVMRSTMKKLESQLNPELFQRIHRSTIVNLERVTEITSHTNGEFYLQLANGTRLKMSRNYKDKIEYFLQPSQMQ